jgi:hypothetical protein
MPSIGSATEGLLGVVACWERGRLARKTAPRSISGRAARAPTYNIPASRKLK